MAALGVPQRLSNCMCCGGLRPTLTTYTSSCSCCVLMPVLCMVTLFMLADTVPCKHAQLSQPWLRVSTHGQDNLQHSPAHARPR